MFWKKFKKNTSAPAPAPAPASEKIVMVTPEEYFLKYLSWQMDSISSSNLNPQRVCYHSYSAMATPMLEFEANNNVPGALEELGERHLYGLDGLSSNPDKAAEYFEKAARTGHPEANGMLAKIYMDDRFGRKNIQRYFELLKKSAERGGWLSMFNLSCAYYKGREQYGGFGFDQDKQMALHWSMQASIMIRSLLKILFTQPCANNFQEYIQNMYRVFIQTTCVYAEQLIDGDGVQKDPAKARQWLQEAAKFHQDVLRAPCRDFEALLRECQ